MKRYTQLIFIIFSGLLCFQLFSTLRVYLSNQTLFMATEAMKSDGYLIVPNAITLDTLNAIGPAFCGGVFFTLTIGALITLTSLLSAYTVSIVSLKVKPAVVALFMLVFSAILFAINRDGLLFIETLSILTTAITVHGLFLWAFNKETLISPLSLCLNAAPLVILGTLLVTTSGGEKSKLFSDFRDSFLMSNRAGMAINDFYYTYTLYPARVFKSLEQQLLKPCHIDSEGLTPDMEHRIRQSLIAYDYLPVSKQKMATIHMSMTEKELTLSFDNKKITTIDIGDFLRNPADVLKSFSHQTDSYGNYRKLTGISLKTGLPLTAYILIHFLFSAAFSLYRKRFIAIHAASVCTLLLGVMGFITLSLSPSIDVSRETLPKLLQSPHTNDRVSALKFISFNSLDISRFPEYKHLIITGNVLERYWLAHASGHTRNPENTATIIKLLDDPHPNVVCQAFYALGKKGSRNAVNEIVNRIPHIENWYVQWYAYRALKRLRWTQTASQQTSF